jgi:hypothetical protein
MYFILNFYDENFPFTIELKEKINCSDSIPTVCKILKSTTYKYCTQKLMTDANSSWKEKVLCLNEVP